MANQNLADNSSGGPLGPLTQAVFNAVWSSLFNSGSSFYLPNLIVHGDPTDNLPVYDPLAPSGVSQPVPLTGLPPDVANTACTSLQYPILPIASATPAIRLMNVKVTGLRAVASAGPLAFSTTDPTLTAVVNVGNLQGQAIPLVLAQNDSAQPNFSFFVPCCVPVSAGSTQCSSTTFSANASGAFTASVTSATITVVIQVNFPPGGSISISVLSVTVSADPADITISVDPSNLPGWAVAMAQSAVNQGIASGAFINGMNAFMNSANVVGNITTLVNKMLAGFP